MITDYQFYWPSELKISEILFGHADYQRVKGGGLSISINRTLRNIRKKRVRAEKASEGGGQFVEIFSWAPIGRGDRRAARSDPPPPLLVSVIT